MATTTIVGLNKCSCEVVDGKVGAPCAFCQRFESLATTAEVEQALDDRMEDYVETDDLSRAIERELDDIDLDRKIGDAVEDAVDAAVEKAVETALDDQLGSAVESAVEDAMREPRDRIEEVEGKVEAFANAVEAFTKRFEGLTFGQRLRWLLTGKL